MSLQIDCYDIGLCDYKKAWDFQKKHFDQLTLEKRSDAAEASNCIILCSHPNVYTLGKSGKQEHVLLSEEELEKNDIAFFKNDRGGDVTYHGPGQLVVYPILDLEYFKTDIGWYVRNLEEVVIRLLADYGIDSMRIEGASGVWLEKDGQQIDRKICAVGVKTSRWVTMHGIALNVNTDLSYFDHIIPCGLHQKGVTSMEKELKIEMDPEKVKRDFLRKFEEVFKVQCTIK